MCHKLCHFIWGAAEMAIWSLLPIKRDYAGWLSIFRDNWQSTIAYEYEICSKIYENIICNFFFIYNQDNFDFGALKWLNFKMRLLIFGSLRHWLKKGTYKTEDRRGNEMVCSFHRKFWNSLSHGLRTPREEITFTAWPKTHSHSRSIFCLQHRPNFSDIIDLCLHWVSVVCGLSCEMKEREISLKCQITNLCLNGGWHK